MNISNHLRFKLNDVHRISVPVTALTEIHTSWFEDTHLCIAFIPNLTEVDHYFSSFSICQVRIEKEITMSSPCSPSKGEN